MEQKECSLKVDKLIEKHAWITSEKQLFGRSGSDYDFTSRDPQVARGQYEKLQAEQSGYGHLFASFQKFHYHFYNIIFVDGKSKLVCILTLLSLKALRRG